MIQQSSIGLTTLDTIGFLFNFEKIIDVAQIQRHFSQRKFWPN